LCAALAVLLATSILITYELQRLHIDKNVQANVGSARQVTRMHLEGITHTLNGLLDFIKEDKYLQGAWLEKDRSAMLRYARPILTKTLSKQQVTHFYFIGSDKVCFLRVHKPDSHGDIIRRYTLDRAQNESGPVSGIELGPFGTLTFRVVHPWWIRGELVGFIELGVEIENLAPKLKKILGSDLIFTVNKTYLDRTRWEEGLNMTGRTGNWDQFSDYVVFSQTLEEIPAKIDQHKHLDAIEREGHIFNITTNQRQYYGGFVPLIDAGNNVLGDIIVLKDITAEESALRTLSIIMIAASVVIGALLFGFFFFFVGRIERRLVKSQNDLLEEIDARKETQRALQQARDRLEVRVQERTAELSQANEDLRRQIEERKQAETALLESEKEHRILSRQLLSAEENERKRIAGEIHDSIGQALSAIKFALESALANKRLCSEEIELAPFNAIVVLTQKTIEEVRRIVMDLRPSSLDDLGILATVNWFCREFVSIYSNLSIEKEIAITEQEIPVSIKTVIYRILQEALNNVVRHSEAKIVKIALENSDGLIEFRIEDDGRGFDIESVLSLQSSERGLGLASIRERVELSGGKLQIESAIGCGARITIQWPIED